MWCGGHILDCIIIRPSDQIHLSSEVTDSLESDHLCVMSCFDVSVVSGQNPTGQNPTGQNPYGQNPTGQNPTGQNPTTWKVDKIPQYEKLTRRHWQTLLFGRSLIISARHASLGCSDMFSQPTVRLESTCSMYRHVSHQICGMYTKRLSTGRLGRINQYWGVKQPILSSGWLQASVNLDAGRGHPNGESESHHANRPGHDRSAT